MTLTLNLARIIIAHAQAEAEKRSLLQQAIIVLDAGGHVVAAERQDGASNNRFDIAFGKAHGALAFGIGSRALMARAEQQPYFITAAAGAIGGGLVPVPGGVLIRDRSGALIGAVGVSGTVRTTTNRWPCPVSRRLG